MRVRCEDICLFSIEFFNNVDRERGKHRVPVSLEPEYALNDEGENKSRLVLKTVVGDKEQPDLPFYFRAEMAGIFSWQDLSEEEAEDEIFSEGLELLLSFARTYLYDIMGKAKMKQMILPIEYYQAEDKKED